MGRVQQICTCMIGCTVFGGHPAGTGSEKALPRAKGSVFLNYLDLDSRQFYKVSVKSVSDLMCLLLLLVELNSDTPVLFLFHLKGAKTHYFFSRWSLWQGFGI